MWYGLTFRAPGFGGLGLQRAWHQAGAAHLASLLDARPLVASLAAYGERAGLFQAEEIMYNIDRDHLAATQLLKDKLPIEAKATVASLIARAAERAAAD